MGACGNALVPFWQSPYAKGSWYHRHGGRLNDSAAVAGPCTVNEADLEQAVTGEMACNADPACESTDGGSECTSSSGSLCEQAEIGPLGPMTATGHSGLPG